MLEGAAASGRDAPVEPGCGQITSLNWNKIEEINCLRYFGHVYIINFSIYFIYLFIFIYLFAFDNV